MLLVPGKIIVADKEKRLTLISGIPLDHLQRPVILLVWMYNFYLKNTFCFIFQAVRGDNLSWMVQQKVGCKG